MDENVKLVLDIVMRWAHIGSAILAVGTPVFMRFVLMPAATSTLDEETHQKLRNAVLARWKIFVHILIALFLISGIYNAAVNIDWKSKQPLYHALFTIKVLAALGIFFIAEALVGKSEGTAALRREARKWLTINVLLAVLVVGCSGIMRHLPPKKTKITVDIPTFEFRR